LGPEASDSAGELARALEHFGAADWQTREADKRTRFTFKAYKQPAVKRALHAVFKGACAYCEFVYAPGTPGHVEHYRPKGAVDTPTQKGVKPGYYWLAATWENLLPACPRCNTEEHHLQPDGQVRKTGKGNQFPLADEAARAREPGDEAGEEPLLLHPYYDEPADHLEFVDELVRARDDSPRGAATIETMGLNRRDLLDERRGHLCIVDAFLTRVAEAEADMAKYPDDPAYRARRELGIAELERLMAAGERFSALVAQRVGAVGPDSP
jgi:hypothetical protein